ncbi:MAG TPA: ribonuclease III [Methanocorpusculum sp.]|nr:ribonuclease III [Methanocorpusculum sp.]
MVSDSPLCAALGYTFRQPSLLEDALTRVSYALENAIDPLHTMDRYAVLGDAVLDVVIVEHLLEAGEHDKGDITQKKINSVNMAVFRRIAESIRLPDYVHWGKGELRMRIWESGRVSAECFEAVAGAAYLDGGMDAVRTIVRAVVLSQ